MIMKIDEVIEKAQKIREEWGDRTVYIQGSNGRFYLVLDLVMGVDKPGFSYLPYPILVTQITQEKLNEIQNDIVGIAGF